MVLKRNVSRICVRGRPRRVLVEMAAERILKVHKVSVVIFYKVINNIFH